MESNNLNNEKTSLLPESSTQSHEPEIRFQRKRPHAIKGLIIAVLLFGWWSCYAIPAIFGFERREGVKLENDRPIFDFDDIVPSEKLVWHSCFGSISLKCARLTVPMDYNRPLNVSALNPKVHIALLLVPGNHNESEQKHSRSPLLINPGGPGGSGTMAALVWGWGIQQTVGADQDVIGFDPRGIGATTPRADCFSFPAQFPGGEDDFTTGYLHRNMWARSGRDIGNVNSSTDSLQRIDTRARTIAKLCEEKDSIYGRDSILKYAHTPSVARDMISIVDAWDEWIESDERASAISEDNSYEDASVQAEEDVEPESSRVSDTKGKLVYWGFSYGTLLGATFASMFPDRVGRIVLDGVVDADHYVAPVWADSIRDADTVFESFPRYCHEAGEGCNLYISGDEVFDIQKRLQGVLDDLKANPITVIEARTKNPVVVSYSDIRMVMFSTLYSPTLAFSTLAFLARLLYEGDQESVGQAIAASAGLDRVGICEDSMSAWLYGAEAQLAIMCSDKRYPLNETLPDLEARFEKMASLSSWADVWMTVMLGCEGWKIKAVDPPMRWDDHPAHKQKPIKTSHPLLFISNTADPVTPLKAGVKMARKFVDAGLVEQHSEGHCSLAAVSKCTINKIAAYFQTGSVPPPPVSNGQDWNTGKWVTCEADEWPFHPYNPSNLLTRGGVAADADVAKMDALKKIQRDFYNTRVWGMNDHSHSAVRLLELASRNRGKDHVPWAADL